MPHNALFLQLMLLDMEFLHTIIAFLFAICTLVVFHELGHYWVARWCNVKVLRFSLGMGKVLYSRRFGVDQTEWVISALPIGGYVKMLDLREQDGSGMADADLAREFTRQPVAKRIAIVAAGPLANLLLAIALFAVVYMAGVPEPVAQVRAPLVGTQAYDAGVREHDLIAAVNGSPVAVWSEVRWKVMQLVLDKSSAVSVDHFPVMLTVTASDGSARRQIGFTLDAMTPKDVEADFMAKLGLSLAHPPAQMGHIIGGGAAQRGGLLEGDIVTSVDGQSGIDSLRFIELVRAAPGRVLQLKGTRSGVAMAWQVTPDVSSANGKAIGKINVEIHSVPTLVTVRDSFPHALKKAVDHTWSTSVMTFKMIGRMVLGEASVKNITGPLTIADYAGQTAKIGWISYISFMAFISISLGVMNLLPIPVLDGGHLLYYSLEVLTGRPVSARFMAIAQRTGFAMLILLMGVAFFNDIARLIPS